MRTLIDSIINRLTALLGGALSARFEARVLMDHANTLAEVEAHARQLEEAGFPELAANLRQKTHRLTPADPTAVEALKLSAEEKTTPSRNGQLTHEQGEPTPPRRRRGRPPKRITTTEPGDGGNNLDSDV